MLTLGKKRKSKSSLTCYYHIFNEKNCFVGKLRVSNHYDFKWKKDAITYICKKPHKISKRRLINWLNKIANERKKENMDIFGNIV